MKQHYTRFSSGMVKRGRGWSRQWAVVIVCALLWVTSLIVAATMPQRPDGDAHAIARWEALVAGYGTAAPWLRRLGCFDLRHAIWPNLAGVGLGVAALEAIIGRGWRGPRGLAALALLLGLGGWGWNRTVGWQGEFFLAQGARVGLGVEGQPELHFRRFLVPPAPAGAGRALVMALALDKVAVTIQEGQPWRQGGWTVAPRWYGAFVIGPGLAPLYLGHEGAQAVQLVGRRAVTVTATLDPLGARSDPPLPLAVSPYAVVRAGYAPGAPFELTGLGLGGLALLWGSLTLLSRRGRR